MNSLCLWTDLDESRVSHVVHIIAFARGQPPLVLIHRLLRRRATNPVFCRTAPSAPPYSRLLCLLWPHRYRIIRRIILRLPNLPHAPSRFLAGQLHHLLQRLAHPLHLLGLRRRVTLLLLALCARQPWPHIFTQDHPSLSNVKLLYSRNNHARHLCTLHSLIRNLLSYNPRQSQHMMRPCLRSRHRHLTRLWTSMPILRMIFSVSLPCS